jgi:hypothetical protein
MCPLLAPVGNRHPSLLGIKMMMKMRMDDDSDEDEDG